MKTKNLNSNKKLSFKKTTIATLGSEVMDDVRGGTICTYGSGCDSRPWYSECVCQKVTHDCPMTN